ncbi:MAG: hypothetical protein ACOX24_07975 [Christensenellales bacterium]|jgi:hypothetical protein
MRKTNIKLKNKSGVDVVYSDIETVSFDGEDGNKKVFSLGNLAEKTIILDFTAGNQEVVASLDELYGKVVILKPDTFVAENIAEGVVIAGIEGIFEGAKEVPTLNTPAMTRNGNTVTITNPSSNGNFNKGFNIYSNGELAFYQTGYQIDLIAKFEVEKNHVIEASCVNPLMNESNKSNSILFAIYSIEKVFDEHITTLDTTTKITDGLRYTFLVKSEFGYWLPENIKVYKKANGSDEYLLTDQYEYSMYNGRITFKSMNGNVRIEVNADTEPQIKSPELKINDYTHLLTTKLPRYAQRLLIYHGDEIIHEEVKAEELLSVAVLPVEGAVHTFLYDEKDGYYKPSNAGVNSSFSLCRIKFTNEGEPTTVKMLWMQFSEHYYDFGMVGKINTHLMLNSFNEPAANILLSGYGKNMQTPQELILDVPTGECFYEVKYKKDGGNYAGWDMFIFNLALTDVAPKMADDEIAITPDYVLKLRNPYYKNRISANVTHKVYADDNLIYTEKEGI